MYTSPFGSTYEPYMDYDEGSGGLVCKCCHKPIQENSEYFYIGDDECYCMDCRDEAIIAIGEKEAEAYIDTYSP